MTNLYHYNDLTDLTCKYSTNPSSKITGSAYF